jgi:chemotaxis protein MotA
MWAIIGYVILMFCVFGGFMMSGGHIAVLFQPIELLIILGAAIGAFVIANGLKISKLTFGALPLIFKPSPYTKELNMEVLSLLYEIQVKARKDGLLSLEKEAEKPHESPIFQKYPKVIHDHHLVEFISDYLRLMVSGNIDVMEIEAIMDQEIETHHEHNAVPSHAITRLADGLPGFGIVAAVMGVVHTMESIGLPPEELGLLIARALVGTFLGILLAYGFVAPLSTALEHRGHESTKLLQAIKVTMLASMNGSPPTVAVEFGRKVLFHDERPTAQELESHVKSTTKKAA